MVSNRFCFKKAPSALQVSYAMCQNRISLLCGSVLQGIFFWMQPATELQAAEGCERVLKAGLLSYCLADLLGSGLEPLTPIAGEGMG